MKSKVHEGVDPAGRPQWVINCLECSWPTAFGWEPSPSEVQEMELCNPCQTFKESKGE